MSDDDLIRRGDALAIVERGDFVYHNISALPAVTVGVKPLVWFEAELPSRGGGKFTSEGYTIRRIEGLWLLDFAGNGKSKWRWVDLDAAKAAAQADYEARILAALEPVAAPDPAAPDLTDPVVVHANLLRGTVAMPTVEQIIHLYGREAFQPMIDVAIAKALEKACLAVSEHADWPEDEHGRTEQVELFARVINAIDALPPAKQDNVADSNAREVGVKPLVDAVEALNAACDAMWNDHHRLEWNPSLFGQEMRIKEKHVKAITEAQQRLPALLAALAPTDAAQAREAGLREALKALDSLPEYGSPDVNIGVSNAYSAILALIQKGGDAYAVDPRHAPHEASPGVTAGAISKGDAE